MKYLAKDGRVFDDERKCMEHERELDANRDVKEKDLEELKKLEIEYRNAKRKYEDAKEAYELKYDEYADVHDLLKRVFPTMYKF